MVPAFCMLALQILLIPSQTGNELLDQPLLVGGTDGMLQYDDGTANWLTWGGLYRGTWFHVQDFSPWGYGFTIDNLEFWFYHHSTGWPDGYSFYAELWNGGGPEGPGTLIDQTSVTAAHYTAVYCYYSPPIALDADFWGIINTQMSSGGWPSNLGDNTPCPVSHSFFSDDFVTWDPWIIEGPTADDYLIRANGALLVGLDQTTWGSIKALF